MKYKWDKKYLYWGVTIFLVAVFIMVFYMMLDKWDEVSRFLGRVTQVLSPFIVGLVLAYLLTPLLNFMEKYFLIRLGDKVFSQSRRKSFALARSLGIILTLSFFVFILVNLIILIVKELYDNSSNIEYMFTNLPTQFNNLISWIEVQFESYPPIEEITVSLLGNLSDFIANWTQTSLMPSINQFLTGLTSGVYLFLHGVLNMFISIIVSIYVMFNKERLAAQTKKLLYSIFRANHVESILLEAGYVHKAFGGFFSGKIVDSFIIGVICFVCVSLLQMPSPALIAIIIGITNIIPFFGPFIGAIPCALLVLLDSPGKCLIFLIFILILQQFDGNILGPKILGETTGLPGLWVIFAIVVGGGFFGFLGMLCGVPVCAVLYMAVKRFCVMMLSRKNLPVETEVYMKKGVSVEKVEDEPGEEV